MNIRNPLATVLTLCVSLANFAQAQVRQELPEIVVTAQLRETSLLREANSTSVLTADTIAQRAAQHLEEILGIAPNVNFAGGTSRARFYQIRGIGERSQFQEPLNPSVGLLLDGIDFSGIGTLGTLFDVEQVEVLRGPQGTLHGANALAGLINVRSGTPVAEPYHRLEAGFGDYNSWSLGLVSSGPLSENTLYRIAAQQHRSDGYTKNTFLQHDDVQQRDELTLRGKLNWLVSEHHQLQLSLTHIDVANGYDAFSLDNVRDTISDQPGQDEQTSSAAALQLNSQLPRFDSELTLNYADTETDYGYDEDWTYAGFHPAGYSSTDRYQRERGSLSAQWRLLSNADSRLFADTTDWAAGFYFLDNQEDLRRQYTYLGQDFLSTFNTETLAVFGQLDIGLSQQLTLVAGLRWENRQTDYTDNNPVRFSPDENLWGGKLALEYTLAADSMLYASVSRGYRANGVNAEILASINATSDSSALARLNQVQAYDEETLLNYEAGLKGAFFNNSLTLRLALFYMDRQDQQVKGTFQIAQATGATTFIEYTENAAEGNNFGSEIELNWLPTSNVSLWLNLGLLKTEYENYINADAVDLSGREQAQAPRYQFALGGSYHFNSGLYVRVDVEGKDGFFFSDRHSASAAAYELLNARIGYDHGGWQLALWGRNLADEDYYVRGFGAFGNDPRNGYATEPYYQYGAPRMIGITANYTF